jgi:hypothetical protein
MTAKVAKAKQAKTSVRYTRDDLAPRDAAADDAALDVYLQRNKQALNASIEKAHAEFERGEYFTLDQAVADVAAQRQRRRERKA